MNNARADAIRANFHFFQRVVGDYLAKYRGRYALVHAQTVVDIFDRPIDALEAGSQKFGDAVFSVQKVTDRPSDLGFMAYGAGDRSPD